MLFAKIKDYKLRLNFSKVEKLKKVNKFIKITLLSKTFKNTKRVYLLKAIYKVKESSFYKNRIHRRCILTNRSRGVYRFSGISRNSLRELLQFGIIPGYKKAVW